MYACMHTRFLLFTSYKYSIYPYTLHNLRILISLSATIEIFVCIIRNSTVCL